jgi:DNA-binding LytR/AlgR family response regulator
MVLILLASVFVALFLIVFQPFGTYEWKHPQKYLLLGGFGLVTFLILLFDGFVIRQIFSDYYKEESWTTAKEICNQLLIIMTISLGNYLYALWIGDKLDPVNFHLKHFLYILWTTFIIGLFPSVAITLYNQNRLYNKFKNPPQPLPVPESSLQNDSVLSLDFKADNGKDSIRIPVSSFLFAEAADNYVDIFFLNEGGTVGKHLLRSSLSRLEKENPHPFLVRCHRSYWVNLHQIEKISGNAQGYRLHLLSTDLSVPVGRSMSERVMEQLNHS